MVQVRRDLYAERREEFHINAALADIHGDLPDAGLEFDD